MFRFLSFSFLLFIFFLLEQTVLFPFSLSPGGFFVSFLALCLGLFFLKREPALWFLAAGGTIAGLFSVTPLFSFLLFTAGGILSLFLRRLTPVEGIFSLPTTIWLGAASYLATLSFVWGSGWALGLASALPASSFRLFFTRSALFALWLLVSLSIVWGLATYWRGSNRVYALR